MDLCYLVIGRISFFLVGSDYWCSYFYIFGKGVEEDKCFFEIILGEEFWGF